MSINHDANRTRCQSPGTASGLIACAIATLAVLVVALESRPVHPERVAYGLPDTRVLAEPDFDARAGSDPRKFLERFYQTGDARYLHYARAALTTAGPQSVADHIVHIRLESAVHRFRSAANLAGRLLEREPRNTEARLLRADALRRAGDVDSARRDCLALAMVGDPVVGHWCAVQILLSEGKVLDAYEQSLKLNATGIYTATPIERWSAEVAAEAAALAGDHTVAAEIYGHLIASAKSGLSARLAYADLLLLQRRPDAVVELLANDMGLLPAQVRIAIAMKQRGIVPDQNLTSAIDTAFAGMSPDETSDLRLRDRAIFELRSNENPQLAIRYALANWEQQKGPEDLSLLVLAAEASNDTHALAIVRQWKARFDSASRS